MSSNYKTIYLVRHAKSSWSSRVDSDYERPLSKRGFKNAKRIGEELCKLNWMPAQVISSPAIRAKQTCRIICKSMGFIPGNIIWNKNIYAADMKTLLLVLQHQKETNKSIMLVGHNPAMEDLLIYLCGATVLQNHIQNNDKLLTTGNVAKITFNGLWKNLAIDNCELSQLLRPKELC